MSEDQNINVHLDKDQVDVDIIDIAESPGEVSNVSSSVKNVKQHTSTSERQNKIERAQKCLENAALVSKRIKEHRKAAAELLGKPFDDSVGDTTSEMATTMSEKTGYSVATEKSTLSVQDALNIPGISESLANTLKQKELLMERIKQYKEISKRPAKTSAVVSKKDSNKTSTSSTDVKKQTTDSEDVAKLISTVKEKENALSIMQVKMRAMETTILDLQEKINEKDQIIEAKNKATTLISDNLSKKEKDSMDLLEDTRQQMTKMQNNFAAMELEWKEEKNRLIEQIDEKNDKINSLQEANTILENSRFEISLAHSKLADELHLKNKEILELQKRIDSLTETNIQESPKRIDKEHLEEEKGTIEIAEMVELTKKIEILEILNFQIRQTNKDLENQLAAVNSESKTSASSLNKKGSPVTTRKGGKNTKSKSPWSNLSAESAQETDRKLPKSENAKLEMMLQSLNKDILDKEYLISQKESSISQLESCIAEKDATIVELRLLVDSQNKPFVELVNVGTDNIDLPQSDTTSKQFKHTGISCDTSPISLDVKDLEEKLKIAQDKINTLNDEIEAGNKNMIKVKSQSKLKLKQLQKTIDNFSKVSDANAEIVKLNEELHQLSQKVAELEEEKGNLQLHLVDYDSGRLTESDVYKKLVEIENLAEARLKSISLLETQKFDLVQELHVLQQKNIELEDKLADMSQIQNDQVCSEIKSVQLEEQIDELIASKKELELVIENLKFDKEQSFCNIEALQREKEELLHKLENYVQENIELTDKLDKLSAEKVSSAESIEIVESLTTQEKLELEEYNKGLDNEKMRSEELHQSYKSDLHQCDENIESLVKQSAELNEKVELFTNERQEVMDKMNSLSLENETLHEKITELIKQCESLRGNITELTEEKINIESLNHQLNQQIEELKNERLEIMKETVEIVKPLNLDENVENLLTESHDEKSAGDKINNRSKSVKQLTKEILKLKNTIKEREAEIADCQMKILSLEEHQQKQKEVIQNSASYEEKIKQLIEENNQLRYDLEKASISEHDQAQTNVEHIQEEIQRLNQEYSVAINARESRIHDLENLLKEYETQTLNYVNTLQQKDKEINDFINQITKLNDVSQKLKSTIELLEEEKAKDQNVEVIKSLNKQISIYQKTLSEYEDKLKVLDEEKNQLASLKSILENNSNALDAEIKRIKDTLNEKETFITELKTQNQKHLDELSAVKIQAKEQDEEIHEIKLQLRKESIENEKLRTFLQQKDDELVLFTKNYEDVKKELDIASIDHKNTSEQFQAMEVKNRELMEKLKKFAVTIKKKSAMYTELECQLNELQNETEIKNQQLENLVIQVESIPVFQEKINHAEEQMNIIANEKSLLHEDIKKIQNQYLEKTQEVGKLCESLDMLQKELQFLKEDNINIKNQNEFYGKKMAEYEVEQKNNSNFSTKISCLEADILKKQSYIEELSNELKEQKESLNQIQLGHGAKVQEFELYIENLQSEIEKYKSRIGRLEETVSMMEYGRVSLERKADQLDNQLQEKRQAYRQYSNQEDELVSRLAYLMDNDRLIAKLLDEIDEENQELQFKMQYLSEEFSELQNTYSDLQDYCKVVELKANKVDELELDITNNQLKIKELEGTVKRLSNENTSLVEKKKTEIDELELEFNTQIENVIKEKKIISEKYEKLCEREVQLELQIQEYHTTLESLRGNIKDLSSENQKLVEKADLNTKQSLPDYTDQYIFEINNLNSVINSKNEEIIELSNKIQTVQTNHEITLKNLENNVSELSDKLQYSSAQVDKYIVDIDFLKHSNEDLTGKLQQREDQIKQLMEKKKLFFEMNIPKTEGLTISSTIEDISDEEKVLNVLELQSQIVTDIGSDCLDTTPEIKKTAESLLSQPEHKYTQDSKDGNMEPPMISKKSYLCYNKDDSMSEQLDPFNSEEGWGMDINEDGVDVTPGLSHLNTKIQKLNEDNQKLKSDLETTSSKLLKALKKLKELKASNDILSNELNISKQISQASMLDMAIESEMSNNLEELDKKIQELNLDLTKEKRDKETLKKQNEVLKNANDRLIEIKEKLDNELELWKYNFKQANDKISSLHWDGESKENKNSPTTSSSYSVKNVEPKDDIVKLEKENDELQVMVDDLNMQNQELLKEIVKLKDEFNSLQKEYGNRLCEECEKYKIQLQNLLDSNKDLNENKISLTKQIQDVQTLHEESLRSLKVLQVTNLENEKISGQIKYFQEKNVSLQQTIESQGQKIISLLDELEDLKIKVVTAEEKEKYKTESTKINVVSFEDKNLKDMLMTLENELKIANETIKILETNNQELLQKTQSYEVEMNDLNVKLQNLNIENDQLLSTVAELRASVSSAVDQRGYEIAELWKQHLAQREGEFQKIEQDLRTQLNVSESKYEQLLDKMQTSNRQETDKIIIEEQVTSLQKKIQEKEENLLTLQNKYSDAMHQLQTLRSEMDDEKLLLENRMFSLQQQCENIIKEVGTQNQKLSEDLEKATKSHESEIFSFNMNNRTLEQQIEEQRKVFEMRIDDLTKQLQFKDSEIYQKTHEFTNVLAEKTDELEFVRLKLLEYEKKIEDLGFEKESELAVLRLKMHDTVDSFESEKAKLGDEKKKLAEALNNKIIECTSLNKIITDLKKSLEEYSFKTAEAQAILENQEIEIVALKEEISSLNDMIRSSNNKTQKHVSFASDTHSGIGHTESLLNKDLLDAVPRAELDLALYMLHQRDVRCEELTMELTQLLEERDTLQLRLSDSLRSVEDLKAKTNTGIDISVQDFASNLASTGAEKDHQLVYTQQPSRSSSISDPDADKPKLQAKLSELRSVKQSRDVRLRHESEQRDLGMRLLHRDVANLPPEAVDQLAQAHHTLTRDSQSTPTVLLNWLRGKSTPKVVHM